MTFIKSIPTNQADYGSSITIHQEKPEPYEFSTPNRVVENAYHTTSAFIVAAY